MIPSFPIQSGDNTRTGTGGTTALGDEVRSPLTDVFGDAWIIAYDDQDPIRSQFFITVLPRPQLNGRCCGLGRVIFGANVVQAISRTLTFDDNFPMSPGGDQIGHDTLQPLRHTNMTCVCYGLFLLRRLQSARTPIQGRRIGHAKA